MKARHLHLLSFFLLQGLFGGGPSRKELMEAEAAAAEAAAHAAAAAASVAIHLVDETRGTQHVVAHEIG